MTPKRPDPPVIPAGNAGIQAPWTASEQGGLNAYDDTRLPQVVQDCHALLLWLIPHLDKFPRNRRYTLGERIESELLEVLAAVTVAAYRRETGSALSRASERLNVARHLWRLAHELEVIPVRRYAFGAELMDGIGRQIGGWLKKGTPRARSV